VILALLIRLEETLVRQNRVVPRAPEALRTLNGFETASGRPAALGLVSDFPGRLPVPADQADGVFSQLVARLDDWQLKPFFEPVSQRVTLSAHAGVPPPDWRLFETALRRMGVRAGPGECLLISGDREDVAACERLGMAALRYAGPGEPGGDFADWAEAPLLVARLMAPDSPGDLERALRLYLATEHRLQLTSLEGAPSAGVFRAGVLGWHSLSGPDLGPLDGVHFELPTEADVRLDERGRVRSFRLRPPAARVLEEARQYLKTLSANGQVGTGPGPLPAGTTHQVETDAEGRRCLTRKRYSAI
jgi:hypothetical protein